MSTTQAAKHTPGPWEFVDREPSGYLVKRAGTSNIHVGFCYRGTSEAEANARLIAAAPELLAALDGLWKTTRDCGYYVPGTMGDAVRAARAAIAKAVGQ